MDYKRDGYGCVYVSGVALVNARGLHVIQYFCRWKRGGLRLLIDCVTAAPFESQCTQTLWLWTASWIRCILTFKNVGRGKLVEISVRTAWLTCGLWAAPLTAIVGGVHTPRYKTLFRTTGHAPANLTREILKRFDFDFIYWDYGEMPSVLLGQSHCVVIEASISAKPRKKLRGLLHLVDAGIGLTFI